MILQERFQKALRMKGFAVFLMTLCCCLSGTQGDHEDQKACCPSDTCSLMKELISIGEKLGAMGEKLGTMGDNLRLMETRLQTSENEVEVLKRLTGGRPQVAFSATLWLTGDAPGNTGPFTTPIPLQYKNVFSNIGSSYNPATGIFTATVKGMYYFHFTMMNNLNTPPNSVVCLTKNGQRLVSVWDTVGTDAHDSGSNAVVIPLEVGDNVYVELQANRLVHDDRMNYNTFSGFLLFPM
ncbi:complement C1q-like protein 2 [Oncorhynchus mykiss]|uniref:C1q domain-containing protein n=2 Tax=Oncorhynchus mykiss TaxID=8022 RepID=A0A8C7PIU8_ONCMY|nr:complement C1q-like protein 2 [Oncorhynchus mykiss]